jgi:hypothetical protein
MDLPRNARRIWLEWELDDGAPRPVLVIATDLPMTPGPRGKDSAGMDEMVEAALQLDEYAGLSITRVRVVPAGVYGG